MPPFLHAQASSQFLRLSSQTERWWNALFSFIIGLSADKKLKEGEFYEKYFWRKLKTITSCKELYPGAGGTDA